MSKLINLLLLIVASLMISSCIRAGGRIDFTTSRLEYPVSASKAIFDENFQPNTKNYVVLNSFEISRTAWFWYWLDKPLTENPDVSDEINGLIKNENGDAVVNLKVVPDIPAYNDFVQTLSIFNFWSLLPFPSSSVVVVTGDIIKVNK